MQRLVTQFVLTIFAALALNGAPAMSLAASAQDSTTAPPVQAEIFAQAREPKARTRIRVSPARNMVRHCVDWYAEERRPSGTVVVPHMRCRWVRR